jgi:hypothetical protein
MPAYNDTYDSDAWQDDESLASTDDLSSHAGDFVESMEDSDFEFLTRSSDSLATEDDEVDDQVDVDSDAASVRTTDATASDITGVSDDTTSVISSEDHPNPYEEQDAPADSILRSTELPSIIREPHDMEDSTATVTEDSRQRPTATPPTPSVATPATPATPALPFNILYYGSPELRLNVLRKIAKCLMAASLRTRAPDSADSNWSSGYTSVVPISNLSLSTTIPEVEFIEDSIVKLKVQDIDSLEDFSFSRLSQFSCTLDHGSKVISCYHRHRGCGRRIHCPWFENRDTYPSLLVYCPPSPPEKWLFPKVEAFARMHDMPLLSIGDVFTRHWYGYKWDLKGLRPEINYDSQPRIICPMLGYEPIGTESFFQIDPLELGTTLWENAQLSLCRIRSPPEVSYLFIISNFVDFF